MLYAFVFTSLTLLTAQAGCFVGHVQGCYYWSYHWSKLDFLPIFTYIEFFINNKKKITGSDIYNIIYIITYFH